jgi:5-methylcytosine-specific restriction endonuclease McrA
MRKGLKIDRVQVYNKCNGKCGYCGTEIAIKYMQVDHIVPQLNFIQHVANKVHVPYFLKHLTLNDLHHIDNLMPTCRVCNKWKNTFHLELFRNEIEQQLKRLHEYNANYRFAKKYGLIEEKFKPIKFYFESMN